MKTSKTLAKWIPAMAIALFGLLIGTVREARAVVAPNTPMVKNLMALTYRTPSTPPVVVKEMNKKDAKRLSATAELPEEHLKLARFYTAEANRLDALATGYERTAATYREHPAPKNFAAPTAAGRYEFFAKGFRSEAKTNRKLAISHEEMARRIVAAVY
jgi:hypothetical protein